jgi:hypothetical protein
LNQRVFQHLEGDLLRDRSDFKAGLVALVTK